MTASTNEHNIFVKVMLRVSQELTAPILNDFFFKKKVQDKNRANKVKGKLYMTVLSQESEYDHWKVQTKSLAQKQNILRA